ncbi:uncharacterized protein F5Z01DRAFT_677822 [Emericellopsis atlantica]|uniref:Uncharacterized protein n=1 Tax=Emericellopsis atlantica TaxID=2614577 RepID=A0A9P8CKB3_9HYPO|nr:uncharacterized protein F5Z01DRAFT_677822 [Emericellopsis atlantica]KAG9250379.1 hypothetical protein F5Z01DRAFT_677822 [Emericellopsis atlantica]
MGSFANAVSSLIETYTKCLTLLKGAHGSSRKDNEHGNSSLKHALRKARSRIQGNYSSRLSQSGRSFEKGDANSRSSLRRIIRRLRAALIGAKEGSTSKHGLDYASLVSLCDSSRSEAIRTMIDLSSRIASSPRLPSRASSGSSHGGSRKSSRGDKPSRGHSGDVKRQRSRGHRVSLDRRYSKNTSSSDSTKLGEVRRRGASDRGREATYPRRSMDSGGGSVRRKSAKWWKLF